MNIEEKIQKLIPEIGAIKRNGQTPQNTHFELIRLYCESNGFSHEILDRYFNPKSSDYFQERIEYCERAYKAMKKRGYLIEDENFSFYELQNEFKEEGYVVFLE